MSVCAKRNAPASWPAGERWAVIQGDGGESMTAGRVQRERTAGPLKSSFEPIADQRTRVLILGALPGQISLERREYYANPTNQFWRLMEGV